MTAAATMPDRVRLSFGFDADALARDVTGLGLHEFIEYNAVPLTAPRAIRTDVDDYADGTWAEWPDTELLAASPALSDVVGFFRRHTRVTLVRLLRLAPGGMIAEHTDPTLGLHVERSVVRLTVPIVTNEHVEFHLNDSPVNWRPGECWYLRFTDPHRATNAGTTERIHLSIDMEPNEWLRTQVARAAGIA